jgi:hypothetical protein
MCQEQETSPIVPGQTLKWHHKKIAERFFYESLVSLMYHVFRWYHRDLPEQRTCKLNYGENGSLDVYISPGKIPILIISSYVYPYFTLKYRQKGS